jgi:type IX secretion system PorP/SprF family membrane protein
MTNTIRVKTVFFACMVFLSAGVSAQTDILLSQQMFSRINYNPASTGLSEDLHFFVLARQQWVGFKSAPATIVINGHTFVPWTQSGWGFSLIGDILGFEKSINPKINYAFHLPLIRSKSSLSFGIGVGAMYKTENFDKAVYEDPNDPERQYGIQSQMKPDFDFGLEYNAKYFNVGTAVTHIGNKKKNNRTTESIPHYYLYGRGMIDINKDWQLTPAISWLTTKKVNLIEGNLTVFMKKKFWGGVSYRINESIVFLAGAYLGDKVMLGYSYDYSTTKLSTVESGTHEIMLSLRIPQPQKSMRATRMRECYHSWW